METLIAPFAIIIAIAVSVWLITSARFRKQIGNAVTSTITVHSEAMVESAQVSRMKSKLDAIQDLSDDGLDKEAVVTRLTDFDEIFMGIKPTATA